MVKVHRLKHPRAAYEVQPTTKVREVDALHFLDTGEVRYISPPVSIQHLRELSTVEVDIGFEEEDGADNNGKSIVFIAPIKHQGTKDFLLKTMLLG